MQKTPLLTATNLLILACILTYASLNYTYGSQLSGFEMSYFENPRFSPIQLFSNMFLHGGTTHLFLNMFGLWMFGNTLEKFWGVKKFIFFYILCGLGASAFYMLVNYFYFQAAVAPLIEAGLTPDRYKDVFSSNQYYQNFPSSLDALRIFQTSVVGASGALYGILAAYAFLFPNSKIMLVFLPVPIAAKFFVPALLAFDVFSEVTGSSVLGQNIAHSAHIGGAITGALLLFIVMKRLRQ